MQIKLSNTDLRWAHWRNIAAEERPPSTSFSLDTALAKMQKLEKIRSNENQINWHKLKLNIGMSREEAHFWMEAIYKGSTRSYTFSVQQVVNYLAREDAVYDGKIGLQELLDSPIRPEKAYGIFYSGFHILPAFVLLNIPDFVHFLNEGTKFNYIGGTLEDVFRLHILPYLSPEEKSAIREAIKPFILANDIKVSRSAGLIGIAGLVGGMDAELEEYLNQSHLYYGNYLYERYAAFGLSNREKVEHYVRSRKIILHDEYIQAWFAHTELDGLDWLAHSIAEFQLEGSKVKAFKAFNELVCPEAVLPLLSLWDADKKSSLALKWLVNRPKLVAETLVPLAFTEHPQSSLIESYLKRMHSMQQTSAIEEAMSLLEPAKQERLRREILGAHENDGQEQADDNSPAWLREGIASVPDRNGLVDWVDILALPPLSVDGHPLNPKQIRAVLLALRIYQENFVKALRENIALEERDAFVWALFESWRAAGASTSDFWVFDALARLGGDSIILKIVPLIERWPGIDHQNRYAKHGLDVLRQMGSDAAFLQLNRLSKGKALRSESLRREAGSKVRQLANQRGLSQEQLEDRLISHCGLDKQGSRIFDYGKRQFTLVLAPNMKPMIQETNGKLRSDLPKANEGDDARLVAEVEAEWGRIKAEIKEVSKVQTDRLEAAMIRQRRWPLAEFQSLFVEHPVMVYIVRRLIWAAYDEAGELLDTFRVDESRQLLNRDDKPLETSLVARVGILHPAELEDSARHVWGEILNDYEIIPPFQQLARKVSQLEAGEAEMRDILRFTNYSLRHDILNKILTTAGWHRTHFQKTDSYERYFPVYKVTGLVSLSYLPGAQQKIDACYFLLNQDRSRLKAHYNEDEKMQLGDVPPVVLSETLRLLYAIASTAE